MRMMRRAGQGGFSFIEILVVMGIISVLVSMVVVVVPMIQEKSRQTKSKDNLRSIYLFMQGRVTEKGWKSLPYNGKNFTLSPIAHGMVDVSDRANLEIFFAPGDAILSLDDVDLERYASISQATLKRGSEDYSLLTSYAGRRNAEPDFKITPSDEKAGALIMADDDQGAVHHDGGFVAAYSNGRIVFQEWGEFENMSKPEDPKYPDPWLGEEAKNDKFAVLSSE